VGSRLERSPADPEGCRWKGFEGRLAVKPVQLGERVPGGKKGLAVLSGLPVQWELE
jgi:hypothetical protein